MQIPNGINNNSGDASQQQQQQQVHGMVGMVSQNLLQPMQGMQGIQRMQPMQGMQGMQSMQHIQGMQGLQGIPGLQGLQPMQGIQGMQGMQHMQPIQQLQQVRGLLGNQHRQQMIQQQILQQRQQAQQQQVQQQQQQAAAAVAAQQQKAAQQQQQQQILRQQQQAIIIEYLPNLHLLLHKLVFILKVEDKTKLFHERGLQEYDLKKIGERIPFYQTLAGFQADIQKMYAQIIVKQASSDDYDVSKKLLDFANKLINSQYEHLPEPLRVRREDVKRKPLFFEGTPGVASGTKKGALVQQTLDGAYFFSSLEKRPTDNLLTPFPINRMTVVPTNTYIHKEKTTTLGTSVPPSRIPSGKKGQTDGNAVFTNYGTFVSYAPTIDCTFTSLSDKEAIAKQLEKIKIKDEFSNHNVESIYYDALEKLVDDILSKSDKWLYDIENKENEEENKEDGDEEEKKVPAVDTLLENNKLIIEILEKYQIKRYKQNLIPLPNEKEKNLAQLLENQLGMLVLASEGPNKIIDIENASKLLNEETNRAPIYKGTLSGGKHVSYNSNIATPVVPPLAGFQHIVTPPSNVQ